MAGTYRNENPYLDPLDDLIKEPYAFEFFAALRLLECFKAESPLLGRSARPSDDAIRLGQTPSLQFAPSTISNFTHAKGEPPSPHKLELPKENVFQFRQLSSLPHTPSINSDIFDKPPFLLVFFFGLFGPNGPLPLHLSEFARHRIRDSNDTTLADFADMFHHRLLSLFYRAWADKEPTVQLDRPKQDRFAKYVGSFFGLGDISLQHRDNLPDHTKLHFAAHLGCQTQHSEGLESMIKDFFQVPVRIHEFIGEWLAMPNDSYCFLDINNKKTGQLGVSSVIGVKSWQCQHKFRITIGPLNLSDYKSFLPKGNKLIKLLALVNNYVGFEYNWDLNLILKREEFNQNPNKDKTPPAIEEVKYGQLGWTSWLKINNRLSDANDLYLAREKMI